MRYASVCTAQCPHNTEVTCKGRSVSPADLGRCTDEMDSSCDLVGIEVPKSLLVKA